MEHFRTLGEAGFLYATFGFGLISISLNALLKGLEIVLALIFWPGTEDLDSFLQSFLEEFSRRIS